jgi:hypothetical protein
MRYLVSAVLAPNADDSNVSGLFSLAMSDAKYKPRYFVYPGLNNQTPIRHDAAILYGDTSCCVVD